MVDSLKFGPCRWAIFLTAVAIATVLLSVVSPLRAQSSSTRQVDGETAVPLIDSENKDLPTGETTTNAGMGKKEFGLEEGGALAITGMAIVFVGLITISLYIAVQPYVLEFVEQFFPVSEHQHGHAPAPKNASALAARDEEEIAVAIAFAMHNRNRS